MKALIRKEIIRHGKIGFSLADDKEFLAADDGMMAPRYLIRVVRYKCLKKE